MTWNPNSGVDQEQLSIAFIYPGNRKEKTLVPLEQTRFDIHVAPENPYAHDIVLMDMINVKSGPAILQSKLNGTNFVYRMRGDIFAELPNYDKPRIAKWGAKNIVMPMVDGVVAVTPYFANRYEEETGVSKVGSAGLWKRPSNWDMVSHENEEIHALTLTNANYIRKVLPILDWAPTIERFLAEHGGTWLIGAKGLHTDKLESGLESYEHIEFGGFVDAESALQQSNVVLHPSNLDGLPNAILEGMVSGLPVITSDWITFRQFDGPNIIAGSTQALEKHLIELQNPGKRAELGQAGRTHIEQHHTPEKIAAEYEAFFERYFL